MANTFDEALRVARARDEANQIRSFMSRNYRDHIDPQTNELCCTTLAEACANALGHNEWLDDDGHIVWGIAVEFDKMT